MTTMTREEALDRIIWSADGVSPPVLYDLLVQMTGLRQVKLDRLFVRKHGDRPIEHLTEQGFRVFNDAKLIEVPSKIFDLTEVELAARPWMLNIMAGACSNGRFEFTPETTLKDLDALKQFAELCREAGTLPCGVTVLTSKDDDTIEAEFNERTPIDQVLWYTNLLIDCGFTDVVCSPEEAQAIVDEFGTAISINTPGIRLPDSPPDDQARTKTPGEAIKAGATRLVIGRPISKGNPAENIEKIVADIVSAA